MTREQITKQVIAAIADVMGVPEDEIDPSSKFEDIGVDSLDAYEIVFQVEEVFDIDVPDELAQGIKSVEDVVNGLYKTFCDSKETT